MASTIEQLENRTGRLNISIDPETFEKAMKQAYNKNKNRFSIPGFRKGKAPFSLVINFYGEGSLYEEALALALDPAYKAALEEHEVEPFSQPKVDIQEIGLDKGVKFSADYAQKPQVTLGKYTGFTAYRPNSEVTDEEVDRAIDEKRVEMSRLVPADDRPIKEDDQVLMDYQGSVDGVPFQGGTAENYTLEIGSGSFIPGFEDQMIGHKSGEEFDIQVTFPEKYHSEELANKEATFHIKVHEVKEKQIPELTDDFVMDISEDCDTVAEYRQQVREKLEKERNRQADQEFQNNILEQVVADSEYEISDLMVQDEAERQFNQQAQSMMYQGFNMQMYLSAIGMTAQQYMQQLTAPALEKIKSSFTLEAVADQEDLQISDEEVDKKIAEMADLYHMKKEDVDKYFDEDRKQDIKQQMRLEKAAAFLGEKSEATDVPPETDETPVDAEDKTEDEDKE